MTVRIQDDLYMNINGEWQNSTVIPADKSMVGADRDLTDEIEKKLRRDLTAFADGSKQTDDQELLTAARLYIKASDYAARDKAGIAPVLPRIQRLLELSTLDDFIAAAPELLKDGYQMPAEMQIEANLNDATTDILNFAAIDTILPDAALYKEDSESNQQMFAAWSAMAKKLLLQAGITAANADQYIKDALAFDARSAQFTITNEEAAEVKNLNNPISWADFTQQVAGTGFAEAVRAQLKADPQHLNEYTPKTFSKFSTLFNADNYTEFLHYAIVTELIDQSGYLSDELRIIGGEYSRFLSGQPEAISKEKSAFRLTNRFMAEPVGIYYGRIYFGEAAKTDITNLVKQIIAEYKVQLHNNTWLSDATREKALQKLDTMKIKMGYPDQALPVYAKLHVDTDDTLFAAVQKMAAVFQADAFAKVDQPVNRGVWGMPGHMVNACYDPTKNDILFPAGILQPPYYDLDWSLAAKLGGTGATIGHEISHAFDNNGALFDAEGNMKNWWTPEDEAAFAKDTAKMAVQFDGLEYEGVKVNGKLCVSENLADNAGMDVALSILGPDVTKEQLQEFFKAYTLSWRTKMRPEFAKTILMQDVHAPATLRVNVPVKNFSQWYTAFNVKPGDGMYMDPANRIQIWNR
ncbi:M13-type metalloendopeptidase [Lacticaseibacillus sharpeae]|nr:M13 family metallopeptidase [Lacticaseibacillus sharpeae]